MFDFYDILRASISTLVPLYIFDNLSTTNPIQCQLSEHIGTKGCSDKKIVRISKPIISLKLGGHFLEVWKCKLFYISRVEHCHKHNTFLLFANIFSKFSLF